MIEFRRPLLSLASVVALLAVPASAQDVQELFREGVELQNRGQNADALKAFQRVLGMDPSNEDAFELWQSTDHSVWLELLAAGGQTELIAKRLMALSGAGRKARSRDEAAIRAALGDVTSNDVIARTRAVSKVSAEFGEFAVPYMVFALGDQGDSDRRVLMTQALTRMNDDVVLPLIAALESQDAYMRRNVALTLGYIGDRRASAALASHAFGAETESSVRGAASDALERLGGSTDIGAQYLALGDAYYAEDDSVLRPGQGSSVVWNWDGTGLVATDIPGLLYAPELAKRAYQMAFDSAGSSSRAIAGYARCVAVQRGRLDHTGVDAGDWDERLQRDELAAQLAGSDALDLALGWALDSGDQLAAAGLCRALASTASAATPNLSRALTAHRSGAVRGEAAVALAAVEGGGASEATVAALAEAAGREVLRIAVIIDGDAGRREAMASALESRGVLVNSWPSGGHGLAALRSVPGVDLIVVADELPDLTLNQVLYEVQNDSRLSDTPALVLSSNEDADYGDHGVVKGAGDIDTVMEAMSGALNHDRNLANDLAARAAHGLYSIAMKGGNVAGAISALSGTLDGNRPDGVVRAALGALGFAGGAAHVQPMSAVLADDGRDDAVRVEAATALGRVFARSGQADGQNVEAIRAVASADGSYAVRSAAARALGRLNLSPETRAELMRGLRAN